MKYIYSPVKQELEEIDKIGVKSESTTPTHPRTDLFNNKHKPQVAAKLADSKIFEKNINQKKISSIDYINRMRHHSEQEPLNESNKLKDAALAASNKRNNVDPHRPSFSDSDVRGA